MSADARLAAQYVLHVLMHPDLDPDETRRVCAELRRLRQASA